VAVLEPLDVRRENVTERVFDELRQAIVDRRLRPGRRLSEAELAGLLGVSKTPVREALIRLRHIGLVEPGPTGGLRVLQPSARVVRNAYEVRRGLESFAAGLAAERAGTELKERIRAAADTGLACTRNGDEPGRRSADHLLHRLIATGSGNDRLAAEIADHSALTWALRQRDVPELAETARCAEQHRRIAAAIGAGDAAAARTAMSEHLDTLGERVLAELTTTPPLSPIARPHQETP
jgi:GntR family transcriptional regulator, rspAB operon transcriptional repressor